MGTRELVLPSLGCTTSEQKVKFESSTAMRECLPSLPAWWRRHVRRRRELFFLASSILNHKILKTNLAFRIQNFPDVECGTPNPLQKNLSGLLGGWIGSGCHTGNREMGRMSSTGQCGPFSNFLCDILSCQVTQYIAFDFPRHFAFFL